LISRERDERPVTRVRQVNGVNGSTNGHVTLAVAGEIDLSTAATFSDEVRALAGAGKGEIVLGFEDCRFIDSSGIRALIMLAREFRARGQTLVLSGLNGSPRRVLEITGLFDGPEFEIRD
jgi:anti-anti-sigma factor